MKKVFIQIKRFAISRFGVFRKSYLVQVKNQAEKRLQKKIKKAVADAYKVGSEGKQSADTIIEIVVKQINKEKEIALLPKKQKVEMIKAQLEKIDKELTSSEDDQREKELAGIQAAQNQQMGNDIGGFKSEARNHKDVSNRLQYVQSQIDQQAPVKKKLLDRKSVFVLFSSIIVVLEGILTTVVFEKLLDLPLIYAVLSAITFSGILIVSAHQIGEAWWKDDTSGRKRAFLLAGAAISFISIARVISDSSNWYLTVPALLILFLCSITISIRKFKYAENFGLLEEKDQLLKKLSAIEKRMVVHMAKAQGRAAKAKIDAENTTKKKINQKIKKRTEVARDLRIEENIIMDIENYFEDLTNEVSGKCYDAYEKGAAESLDVKPFSSNSSFWGKGAAMFSLAMILTFSGCQTQKDSYMIYVGADFSGSMEYSNTPSNSFHRQIVYSDINLYGDHHSGIEGEVRLFIIGDPILSESRNFTIPSTGNILFQKRQQVEDSLKAFDKRLEKGLIDFFGNKANHGSTNLFRNIGFRLNELASSKATHKIMYLATDAVAQSSILDYATLQKNPKALKDNYQKYASILDEAFPTDDLSGITVVLVYADTNASELSWYSRYFLKAYYQSKNAKVISMSNL